MQLTSADKELLADARQFAVERVRPLATEIDQSGQLPKHLLQEMGKRRYLGATFPEKHGGLGLDPVTYGLLTEELGVACCNTRALLTLQVSLVGETILRWGTEQQIEQWIPLLADGRKMSAFALTEPGVGSNAKGIETSYSRKGDEFVLSGNKKWTTFGAIADMYIVIARDSDSDDITAFIVERERDGITAEQMSGLLGMRGCHIAELTFDNVAVPEQNVLGGVGNGFRFVAGTALDHGRYSIAWAGASICRAAMEAMVSYARQRTQFGKKLYEFQLIKGLIGDATTATHAARALCLRAGELRAQGSTDALMETTIAKHFAASSALKVATDAVQVHGGNGCCNRYPAERLFREAKILGIIEGSDQMQQLMISKHAMQEYAPKRSRRR